MISDKPAFV